MAYKNKEKDKYLSKCIEKAKIYNGFCLSKEFVNSRTKLIWKCKVKDHLPFEALYTNVVNGMGWCPKCPPFIENKVDLAHFLAKSKDGEFLEGEYLGASIKHKWKCQHNHIFESQFNLVVDRGRWCVFCANQVTEKTNILDIEESANEKIDRLQIAKKFAESKKGECLSSKYINSSSKLLWKCSNKKHLPFESTYNGVVNQNRWCPKCGESHINEERVRNILNNIFKTNFIRSNPEWNINPKTGKLLELDGYCEKLKIAFEYQGAQHFDTAFNKDIEEVLEQQERDEVKAQNCKKNGIKLIIVMASRHYDNYKSTMKSIIKGINNQKITINSDPMLDTKNEEIYNTTTNHVTDKKLQECIDYADLQKGFCLSKEYVAAREKMIWQCKNPNHPRFIRSYEGVVKNKTWCPACRKEGVLCSINSNIINLSCRNKFALFTHISDT